MHNQGPATIEKLPSKVFMEERNVDVAIVDADTAGLGAYRAARQHAHRVAGFEC
ncbi:hypothetical protein [Pistricoccus aurantiacus]|uniref:hypothetical protein n=1 Tax=Pistricoccus aurantiacus TaxID=1883414 RepID=UPI003628F041